MTRRSALHVAAVILLSLVVGAVLLSAPWEADSPISTPQAERSQGGDALQTTPPALVGRAARLPEAEESPVAPRITVGELDQATTRTRTLHVRVEGDVPPDEEVHVEVLDVHGDRVAMAVFFGPREIVFPPLAWGEYAVVARSRDRIGERRAAWNDVTVVRLAAGRRVRGIARVMNGDLLPGVGVRLHPEYLLSWGADMAGPLTPPSAVSDEQGRFELLVPRRDDGRGTWLACRHPLYGGVFHVVPAGSGTVDTVVHLGYQTDVAVPMHVVGEDGDDLVPRLRWSVTPELAIAPTVTSARFVLAWPGGRRPLELRVDAVGYESVTVERPADTTRELRVVLPKKPWMQVRVRDTRGVGVPGAEVTLLGIVNEQVEWLECVRTSLTGDAHLPLPASLYVLQVRSPGLVPAFVLVDEEQERADVVLADDAPPLLVLPDGLHGFVDISHASPDGVLLWERRFQLDAVETTLPGLPRGPKKATVWMEGRQFRHEIEFDAETRLHVPVPADWPGRTQIVVEVDGGGDLDGVRTRVNELRPTPRAVASPKIEGQVARFTVLRGRPYEMRIPSLGETLRFPFDVGLGEEEISLRWVLPADTPTFGTWAPRFVDEVSGESVSGGYLEVLGVVDAMGNLGQRRRAEIDEGRAETHVARERKERARVVVPGYAESIVGPLPGDELLRVETVRLTRPLRLQISWPAEVKLRVFAFDARILEQPSPMNLSPRSGKNGTLEVHGGESRTHVVWAMGDRWARPRRVAPGTRQLELDLASPAAVEVMLPAQIEDATEARIWLEYRDLNVGYSPRGQWRVLPYAPVVAMPGEERDGRATVSIARCPPGSCTVVVVDGEARLLETEVVLAPGEQLVLEVE